MNVRLSIQNSIDVSHVHSSDLVAGPELKLACVAEVDNSGPPVILVHGLGQTIADWPDCFVSELSSQGVRPIRFDNRDAGRSTRFDQHGEPPFLLQAIGRACGLPGLAPPSYSLASMAGDVFAVMDMLGLRRAHLVGVSMGGMIVQHAAAMAPERVLSMTCIMSSSGTPGLPRPREDVEVALATVRDAGLAEMLAFRRLVAGRLTPQDSIELTARVTASFAYGQPHGTGMLRQYAAIMADRDRHLLLPRLHTPSLIIHGEDDPFVCPDHGIDLAARIPGAMLHLLPLMGHEITASYAPILSRMVAGHVHDHSS